MGKLPSSDRNFIPLPSLEEIEALKFITSDLELSISSIA